MWFIVCEMCGLRKGERERERERERDREREREREREIRYKSITHKSGLVIVELCCILGVSFVHCRGTMLYCVVGFNYKYMHSATLYTCI